MLLFLEMMIFNDTYVKDSSQKPKYIKIVDSIIDNINGQNRSK